jgi:hypothetical protein
VSAKPGWYPSANAVLAGSIIFKTLDEANRAAARLDLQFLREGNPRHGHIEVVPFGDEGWIYREVQRVG